MANPEHLAKLKEGVEAWNEWREDNVEVEPDLSEADLYSANLSSANLSEANLSEADLYSANLSNADLSNADLSSANLSRAKFSNTDLSGVNLNNANLREVNLSNADLSEVNLSNADLGHSDLIKTDLSSANLSEANLSNAYFSEADLSSANLSNANLGNANLNGASLIKANLSGTFLSGTYLSGAYLIKADLIKADLFGANLSETNLSGADLSSANLNDADFSAANLSNVDLSNINLSNVDFNNADLSRVNLNKSNLNKSNLSNANLIAVQALTTNFQQATLTGAIIEDWHIGRSTKLDGVKCDYIFRKRDLETGQPTARLPADPNSTFAPGEFVQRFQILESALETIDLTFTEGIDWKAFFTSFQELRQQRPDDEIAIQGIERKGAAFIVRLEVPQEADKGAIETRVKQLYETERKVLEAQYEERLRLQGEHLEDAKQTIETERREKATLMGIMTTMANNQGPRNDFRGAKFAGGFAETVQGDQIGGTFNDYSINATPDEISALITRLADISQSFPAVQSQEVHIHLEDLANDLAQEQPQRSRLRTRLAALLGVEIAVGTTVATATDFANNVLELSQKLSIPPTEFQPQLQQLQQIQPDFF